jgi:hypothetical protein
MQTLKKRKQKNVDSSVQRGSQSRCVLEVFINFTSGPSQISSSGLRCVCFHVMQEPIVKKNIRLLRKTPSELKSLGFLIIVIIIIILIIIIMVTCLGPFHFWGHGREWNMGGVDIGLFGFDIPNLG